MPRLLVSALSLAALYACPANPSALKVQPSLHTGGPEVLRELTFALADPALNGRDEGSEGGQKTREWLVAQMTECALKPAGSAGFLQAITTGNGTNVLARIPGTAPTGKTVLLSAHYDHQDGGIWAHPGAYDNATAVAALARAACALAANPTEQDILIAFWDAEEPPTFLTDAMGSRFWAEHPTVSLDTLEVVVVLDLLGEGMWDGYDRSFVLGAESAPQLRKLLPPDPSVQVASLSLVENLVVGHHQVWSDYDAFRNRSIPFLFMTDGQNPRYHTTEDTADAVDYAMLHRESQWVEQLARNLSVASVEVVWNPKDDKLADRLVVLAMLEEALGPNGNPGFNDTARKSLIRVQKELFEAAPTDAHAQRRAAQMLMCWSGPMASMFTCGML